VATVFPVTDCVVSLLLMLTVQVIFYCVYQFHNFQFLLQLSVFNAVKVAGRHEVSS